jgi:hypothetical protein
VDNQGGGCITRGYLGEYHVLMVFPTHYILVLSLYMLSRLRNKGPPPDPNSIHYSTEHVSLAKTLGRRRWLMNKLDERIPLIR